MSEPNNIDPKAVKVLNEFAKNKLPNNLEWLDELLDLHLQNIKAGHKDKLKLAITAKINEIKKQAYHNGRYDLAYSLIPVLEKELTEYERKRKDEVLK